MKHIRDAIELSGVPPSQVRRLDTPGHVILVVNGRRITCSSSPKNPHVVSKKIAGDIRRAAGAQE
jgi:hypothetical protein